MSAYHYVAISMTTTMWPCVCVPPCGHVSGGQACSVNCDSPVLYTHSGHQAAFFPCSLVWINSVDCRLKTQGGRRLTSWAASLPSKTVRTVCQEEPLTHYIHGNNPDYL